MFCWQYWIRTFSVDTLAFDIFNNKMLVVKKNRYLYNTNSFKSEDFISWHYSKLEEHHMECCLLSTHILTKKGDNYEYLFNLAHIDTITGISQESYAQPLIVFVLFCYIPR